MKQEIQQLIEAIKSLDIDQTIKGELIKKLQNEEFTDELFSQIDSLLEEAASNSKIKVEALNAEIKELNEELNEEQEKNVSDKQKLFEDFRAELKLIYNDTLREGDKIEGEADKVVESIVHDEEIDEADAIKKSLQS